MDSFSIYDSMFKGIKTTDKKWLLARKNELFATMWIEDVLENQIVNQYKSWSEVGDDVYFVKLEGHCVLWVPSSKSDVEIRQIMFMIKKTMQNVWNCPIGSVPPSIMTTPDPTSFCRYDRNWYTLTGMSDYSHHTSREREREREFVIGWWTKESFKLTLVSKFGASLYACYSSLR